MEHGFVWFSIIPYIKELPLHVSGVIFATLIIISLSFTYRFLVKRNHDRLIPKGKLSLENIFELAYEGILNLLKDVIGEKEGPRFFPLIAGTFIFIFVCNILGVIPGFQPPTDNLNTNAACAIVIFIATHYYGIKSHKFKYMKHFTGPIWWLAIIFIPIEIVSHLARPFSLSLRLYGNMLGDHTVLGIFSDLVPLFVPVVFIGLGVFVSFIQAFIFSMLSMMYIGGAIADEH